MRAGTWRVQWAKMLLSKFTLLSLLVTLFVTEAAAQYTPPPPPPNSVVSPQQLEQLVARIALYPDPLLAQILTASTYWSEIPEAAAWANQHSYLTASSLADAIRADNLQFDPSILALLPFPAVLNMMAQDMAWTQQLGNAALLQRADVMDAIQRLRTRAYDYGYLRSNAYYTVTNVNNYIEIQRVYPHLLWGPHEIIIDETPWRRVWANRGFYVHPYEHPWVRRVGPRVEHHP